MRNWATDRITFDQGRQEATDYLESKGYRFTVRLSDAFQTEKWENDRGRNAYLALHAHGVYHLRGYDL